MTAEVCEPLSKYIGKGWLFMKWYYQELHDKIKKLFTKVACMKFYNASKPLYLEMDTSDSGRWAGYYR